MVRRMARVIAALLLLLGACAAQPPPTPILTGCWDAGEMGELLPIVVSSELAVGENRFLLNLVDRANEPLASPDRPVELRFFHVEPVCDEPAVVVDATFLPTIPQLPGLYRAEVDFDRAGDWGLEAATTEADGSQRTGRMHFTVREQFSTPAIGAAAPPFDTPTADSADEIARISTDPEPDPDFYTTSISEALGAGEPFLLIFSTPAFCRTATCGPALDIVKSVAPEYKERVTFIHVEPYQLEMVDGQLQPVLSNGQLVPVPAVAEWGLLTEPYIFVVDAGGTVSAKLEGVASADEIRAALAEVAP
jgi:hypothetical protein